MLQETTKMTFEKTNKLPSHIKEQQNQEKLDKTQKIFKE
jgi:hypothetical protein